jgi:hypothetical protein
MREEDIAVSPLYIDRYVTRKRERREKKALCSMLRHAADASLMERRRAGEKSARAEYAPSSTHHNTWGTAGTTGRIKEAQTQHRQCSSSHAPCHIRRVQRAATKGACGRGRRVRCVQQCGRAAHSVTRAAAKYGSARCAYTGIQPRNSAASSPAPRQHITNTAHSGKSAAYARYAESGLSTEYG